MTTYGECVHALRPIIPVVFDALQAGLTIAAEEHESRRLERAGDPHYFSHGARRIAVEHFKSKGLLHLDDGGRRSALPMSGIRLDHAGHRLWLFRSGEKEVPLPGHSVPKQDFYGQKMTLEGWNNLLLLWRDEKGVLEDPLWLVRPLGGNQYKKSLALDWQGPLTRAMADMRESDLHQLKPLTEWKQLGSSGTA